MSKKQVIGIDPTTHEPSVWATVTLTGNKVSFEPKDASKRHSMLKSLVVGSKLVKPEDGKQYFDALDRLRGTYYYVKKVD